MIHVKYDGETVAHFLRRITAWTIEDAIEAGLMRPNWRSIIE